MRTLDNVGWTGLGEGSIFQASRSNLNFEVVSPIDNNKIEKVVNKVVIKRIRNWSTTDRHVQSFNRELRILNHFRGTSSIVQLRGIGWFYNWNTVSHITEPVLMLEEADATLQYLVSPHISLSSKIMLSKSSNPIS
jgi:hypothetical protein